MYLAEVKCPYKKKKKETEWFCEKHLCADIPRYPEDPLSLQLHMIPPSLEEEGCEDEGIGAEGGGGGGVRLLSSYQHQRQKDKAAHAGHVSHCSK